jgi:hypothetical protein
MFSWKLNLEEFITAINNSRRATTCFFLGDDGNWLLGLIAPDHAPLYADFASQVTPPSHRSASTATITYCRFQLHSLDLITCSSGMS